MKRFTPLVPSILLLLIITWGCDSLIDTEPQQSVDPDYALTTPEGIQAVYGTTYNRIVHENYYGQALTIQGDALADNMVSHPTTSGRLQCQPLNQIGCHIGGWNRYLQINEINLVLEHAEEIEDLNETDRTRIMGEMHFMRALSYHDLAKVYAYEPNQTVDGFDLGVIIRTEPTENIDDADFRSRATVQEVYELIESDLLTAIDLLSESDGDAPHFANRAAAEALLARVYLYWERWEDAEEYATRALSNTDARIANEGEVPTMYESESGTVESLFELRVTTNESVGVNESLAALLTPPGHYDGIPSDEFLSTLEDEDVRNELYPLDEDVYPDVATGHRFVIKYNENTGSWADNIPVLRYSEVLLTRAEARQEAGIDGALDDLNEVRTNRGLEALAESEFDEDPIGEILEERRRELAFEGGHRWHDLKRRGMDVSKPEGTRNPLVYGEHTQYLARIPTGEVALNPDLEQNPGY